MNKSVIDELGIVVDACVMPDGRLMREYIEHNLSLQVARETDRLLREENRDTPFSQTTPQDFPNWQRNRAANGLQDALETRKWLDKHWEKS